MVPDSSDRMLGSKNQMGPERGRDKLGEVTAFSTSLVAECVLDFVKMVLMGGGSIVPSAFIQRKATIVPGRCVRVMRLKGAGAWEGLGDSLSKRSPVAALTACLSSVSHQGEGRKLLVSGLMGRVPTRFAMSPTQ